LGTNEAGGERVDEFGRGAVEFHADGRRGPAESEAPKADPVTTGTGTVLIRLRPLRGPSPGRSAVQFRHDFLTMTDTTGHGGETMLVMNPRSGDETHAPTVRDRAALVDYEVRETEYEQHAIELAREAANAGAEEIVAVGGDGTLNEVVRGVSAADSLADVTLAVVPAGTGNDFATNIGITGIDDAFDVIATGDRRRLDLGLADGRPFLNSCVAGITAEASQETSSSLKSQFGVLAYVLTTLRMASAYTGIEISATVDAGDGGTTVWEGAAAIVLVGNGRRFSRAGSEQANLEDGLLDVAILEDVSSVDLARDHLAERLFDETGTSLTRFQTSSLDLRVDRDETATFSLDGEMLDLPSVTVRTRDRVVEMCVGDGYERPSDVE
ncbi:MAG: diacylglycerol/lipid kinase family protein, partial [Halanaeroarchaeum sp.]